MRASFFVDRCLRNVHRLLRCPRMDASTTYMDASATYTDASTTYIDASMDPTLPRPPHSVVPSNTAVKLRFLNLMHLCNCFVSPRMCLREQAR